MTGQRSAAQHSTACSTACSLPGNACTCLLHPVAPPAACRGGACAPIHVPGRPFGSSRTARPLGPPTHPNTTALCSRSCAVCANPAAAFLRIACRWRRRLQLRQRRHRGLRGGGDRGQSAGGQNRERSVGQYIPAAAAQYIPSAAPLSAQLAGSHSCYRFSYHSTTHALLTGGPAGQQRAGSHISSSYSLVFAPLLPSLQRRWACWAARASCSRTWTASRGGPTPSPPRACTTSCRVRRSCLLSACRVSQRLQGGTVAPCSGGLWVNCAAAALAWCATLALLALMLHPAFWVPSTCFLRGLGAAGKCLQEARTDALGCT